MRVLLRCDATSASGVGHLVRCLALAEEVAARGGTAVLAGTVDAPLARRLVAAAGVACVPGADDPAGLAAAARAAGAQLVHVDHYGLGADLRPALAAAGVALSSAEDGTYGRRPADVVVDATLGAEDDGRPDDGSGVELLGVRYAPVRALVRRARDAREARDARDPRVLVVLGGTDATGVTPAVVALCLAAGVPAGSLTVLAPAARQDAVRAVPGAAGIHLAEPDDALPARATASDMVLSAAGTTVVELACLGVATGVVAVVDNQLEGYARAVDAGIVIGVGTGVEVAAGAPAARDAVARLVGDGALRARLGARGSALVDGLGAARVVDAWERATGTAPAVTGRPATTADAALLLAWRNDPETRAASRTTAPVALADHARWLAAVLADPSRVLLVAERGGVPVGTVRFDREGDALWEVSITVAPDARGRGLAGPALAAGEAAWRSAGHDGALLAYVRPENAASLHLFEGAGYRRAPERDAADVVALVKPA